MKKLIFIVSFAVALSSCSVQTIIPRAVNTVNSVSLKELNLERKDYEILNTVSAEAIVNYTTKGGGNEVIIEDEAGGFSLHYIRNKQGNWSGRYNGILRLGYLHNDYADVKTDIESPENVVRRLAIYRLINEVNQYGGDGVIEPIISTNVEQIGKTVKTVKFKSTVTAKIIKLKTDR